MNHLQPKMSERKLTYQDFLTFPDDGQRHELIDGVHYVTPLPNLDHQRLSLRLLASLNDYLEAHPLGEVFPPLDVVLSDYDVVEPDVLVLLVDQGDIVTEANLQGPPAIVAEILSPSTRRRDLGIKFDLYDREGVREYLVVDPKARVVRVWRRNVAGALDVVVTLAAANDDTWTTPLLPGFSLSMAALFRPGLVKRVDG